MGESNAGWGELETDESRALWDTFDPLPQPGRHQILDAFVERKRISIDALVRLGTRIQGNTLAYAFPDGIKFRDIETDQRWNELGTEWRQLKIVPAGPERSNAVVVAEGETDAARLTQLLPGVDVAVLPAGARGWHSGFTAQLQPYELVLIGTDNDARGNEGAAVIAEHLPQAVRYPPPSDAKDWCAFDGDEAPPLPEPPQVELYAGLRRTRLGALVEGGLEPPEAIVPGLVHEIGVHWRYGRPGGGKTTIAMYCCEHVMREDRPVVWFDFEGGDYVTALRLQDMEIPLRLAQQGKDIDELFYYFPWPDKVEMVLPDLVRAVAPSGPAPLVVFDSASKALSLTGRNENDNGEVTQWNAAIVRAAKTLKLPVIVIDHVAKATNSGPRGAGAKSADADVVWHVETPRGHEFDRTRGGLVKVALADKGDRYGVFQRAQWFEVGDGEGTLTVKPGEAPDSAADDSGSREEDPFLDSVVARAQQSGSS